VTEGKDLIDLEELFKQKKLQDKSLANLAIDGLTPYLEDLPEKRSIFAAGAAETKGGNYPGSIRTAGAFASKGVTVTNALTTAGAAAVNDLIVVKQNTTLAGATEIVGNAVFAGKTRLAGSVHAKENIIASTKLTLSGTIIIDKQIITDGPISGKGTLKVDQIQSLDDISLRGKLFCSRNITAKKLQLSNGSGEIGGDIMAKEIGLGNDRHLKRYLRNYENDLNLYNPITLAKYIGGIILGPIFNRQKGSESIIVEGDVVGHDVFLENVTIKGDINAKRITIGDNVIIQGRVEYSESLKILNDAEYTAFKISAEEIRYLDPADPSGFLATSSDKH